ncbi:hypothetical protein L873DRAFT_1787080 [Choiromyces venosus 120613-1]|uniref:Uncharacterized protein n=1 Tax=Choiromyces venosus 120613-1 TaxID=1336337 RepID=A0A3N4KBF3_9PEZI|nr:hypothetical protein L873DRAFT_1787080 [Choiromyces venosus 120613-1]
MSDKPTGLSGDTDNSARSIREMNVAMQNINIHQDDDTTTTTVSQMGNAEISGGFTDDINRNNLAQGIIGFNVSNQTAGLQETLVQTTTVQRGGNPEIHDGFGDSMNVDDVAEQTIGFNAGHQTIDAQSNLGSTVTRGGDINPNDVAQPFTGSTVVSDNSVGLAATGRLEPNLDYTAPSSIYHRSLNARVIDTGVDSLRQDSSRPSLGQGASTRIEPNNFRGRRLDLSYTLNSRVDPRRMLLHAGIGRGGPSRTADVQTGNTEHIGATVSSPTSADVDSANIRTVVPDTVIGVWESVDEDHRESDYGVLVAPGDNFFPTTLNGGIDTTGAAVSAWLGSGHHSATTSEAIHNGSLSGGIRVTVTQASESENLQTSIGETPIFAQSSSITSGGGSSNIPRRHTRRGTRVFTTRLSQDEDIQTDVGEPNSFTHGSSTISGVIRDRASERNLRGGRVNGSREAPDPSFIPSDVGEGGTFNRGNTTVPDGVNTGNFRRTPRGGHPVTMVEASESDFVQTGMDESRDSFTGSTTTPDGVHTRTPRRVFGRSPASEDEVQEPDHMQTDIDEESVFHHDPATTGNRIPNGNPVRTFGGVPVSNMVALESDFLHTGRSQSGRTSSGTNSGSTRGHRASGNLSDIPEDRTASFDSEPGPSTAFTSYRNRTLDGRTPASNPQPASSEEPGEIEEILGIRAILQRVGGLSDNETDDAMNNLNAIRRVFRTIRPSLPAERDVDYIRHEMDVIIRVINETSWLSRRSVEITDSLLLSIVQRHYDAHGTF